MPEENVITPLPRPSPWPSAPSQQMLYPQLSEEVVEDTEVDSQGDFRLKKIFEELKNEISHYERILKNIREQDLLLIILPILST